jgi:predicted HTH domain antitoxin
MTAIHVELEDDLVVLLREVGVPIEQTARDMLIMELYRRGVISSGKGAELLGMHLEDFIGMASQLRIPYFDYSAEELARELAGFNACTRSSIA